MNNNCTRSAAEKTSFVKRVNTWEDRLFLNVPRVADDDPRYSGIRIKNFMKLDSVSISDWSKPTPTPTQEIVEKAIAEHVNNETEVKIESQTSEESPIKLEPVQTSPIQESIPVQKPSENTQFQQGTILNPASESKILEPGATYTFGDD